MFLPNWSILYIVHVIFIIYVKILCYWKYENDFVGKFSQREYYINKVFPIGSLIVCVSNDVLVVICNNIHRERYK